MFMHLLTTSPEAIQYLRRSDPVLARLTERIPAPVYDSSGDVYYDLLSCVVDQQIHYRANRKTGFTSLLALFSGGYPHPAQLLRLPEEEVLATKLSAVKYRTLCHLATHWLTGEWSQTDWNALTDEIVRVKLRSLGGIGPWTTDMILLFTLGRPDVFPMDDYQLKKTLTTLYQFPADQPLTKTMSTISQRWTPYCSLACQYIWAYAGLPAKTKLLLSIP